MIDMNKMLRYGEKMYMIPIKRKTIVVRKKMSFRFLEFSMINLLKFC